MSHLKQSDKPRADDKMAQRPSQGPACVIQSTATKPNGTGYGSAPGSILRARLDSLHRARTGLSVWTRGQGLRWQRRAGCYISIQT
nr:hypothetical protein CFP56_78402 [Quercus suber]